MKIPNIKYALGNEVVSLARIVSEDSQHGTLDRRVCAKSSKDS